MAEIMIKFPDAIVCVEIPVDSHWTEKTVTMRLAADGLDVRRVGEFVIVDGTKEWKPNVASGGDK